MPTWLLIVLVLVALVGVVVGLTWLWQGPPMGRE